MDPERAGGDPRTRDRATATSLSLIARLQNRQPEAWEQLLNLYGPLIYSWCRQSELSPEDFQTDGDQACVFSDFEVDGDTISWSMECPNDMGTSRGQWSFTSEGDSVQGEGSMTVDAGGQSMEFTMNWTGRRIGDCKA